MEFDTWEPIYEAICADFGFEREEDERVAAWMAERLGPPDLDRLAFEGDRVGVVVGAGLDREAIADLSELDRVVTTADALERLDVGDIHPSLVVTDLDSTPARTCAHTRCGSMVAVHAHGDNEAAIKRWLPRMELRNVVGTTQGAPGSTLVNFGGFTDGDRAAYLADGLGADSIELIGWKLGDSTVGAIKQRKLEWASALLSELESHRGEHYEALDGHRVTIGELTG